MGTGAGTEVKSPGRTQDGNRDGSGYGSESTSADGNGNEDVIGEGGREANTRKKPHNTCRRGNGRDLGGKGNKRRKERFVPVPANPDNLENNKKTGGGGTRYPGLKYELYK